MRVQDWRQQLEACVARAAARRFRYGGHDCCLFAADVVLALTGRDVAADLRGYRGRRQALEILSREGGFVPMVSRLMGSEPIQGALATRGDVVFGHPIAAGALGVCLGRTVAFPASEGLAFAPRLVIECAWRVE